jgi:hypothetical protein
MWFGQELLKSLLRLSGSNLWHLGKCVLVVHAPHISLAIGLSSFSIMLLSSVILPRSAE